MTKRDWLEIKARVAGTLADTVADLMEQLGALSVTWQDAADSPILEPKPGERRLWPDTEVTGLFTKDADKEAILSTLTAILGDHVPLAALDLEDQDWVRAWMDNFKPLQCASNLWICPSWCTPPDPGAAVVMLDPGLAFGTGTHPTTFLCLKRLAALRFTGKRIIDYGCGSGILAIAALKLGAASALGVDIDEQALIASRDNATRNGVAERLSLFLSPAQQPQEKAPVVVANILAGPLTELEPVLASLCESDGTLLLSGLLDEQADEICEAYARDFLPVYREVRDGWALLELKRLSQA